MVFLHLMEVGEYGVAFEPESTPLHVLLTSITSILALIAGAVFHSTIESRGLVKCLSVHVAYAFAMFVCRALRWVYLRKKFNLDWNHVRFSLCVMTCCGFALLAIADCLVLLIEVSQHFLRYYEKRSVAFPQFDVHSLYVE